MASKHKNPKKRARSGRARAVLGDKSVSMHLVAGAFRGVAPLGKLLAPAGKATHWSKASFADVAAAVTLPPIPAVFPCAQGDRLHCVYTVVNTIVAEAVLFLAPDENGDGEGDRLDEIGRSPSSQVSGQTAELTAGWSYLVWDFHPANQGPWTAMLSISVNGGPAQVFGETSDEEASHHQAGMLIWAEPHA